MVLYCSMPGANSSATPTPTTTAAANPTSSSTNPAPSSGGVGAVTPELLQQMLGGVVGAPPLPQQQQLAGNQLQQAEVLYQSQLEQMQMMGFHNRQANLNGELGVVE